MRSQYQRKDRLSTRLESVEGQIDDLMPEGEEDLDEAKIQAKAAVDAAKEKRETHTEGDRDDSLPTETEEREAKRETVEALQSELEELNPEELEARKERTEDALATTKEEKDTLNGELNKIRGRLESEDLRGLHGRLEEAKQELEEAQADVDRLQRQAEAAKLLYETLTESRAEARKKYLAPLREEAEQLLDRFFDAEECSVEFGEEFDLQQLSRSSDGSFAFDQLSTGAKQQLSQ